MNMMRLWFGALCLAMVLGAADAEARKAAKAADWTGVWAGRALACLKGEIELRIEFGKADPDGYDVLILARPLQEARPQLLRARIETDRRGTRLVAAAADAGMLKDYPLTLRVKDDRRGRLSGGADSPSCSGLRLKRVDEPLMLAEKGSETPDALRGYAGSWDGAIFGMDGDVTAISFDIKATRLQIPGRMFDAVILVDGKEQRSALMGSGKSLGVLPDTGPGVETPRSAIRGDLSLYQSKGGSGEVLTGILSGHGRNFTYLWRRPPGRNVALATFCAETIAPIVEARASARMAGRELKIAFYPALASYDIETASLAAAIQDRPDLAALQQGFLMCALTAPRFSATALRLYDGFVPIESVAKFRQKLGRMSVPEENLPPGGFSVSMKTLQKRASASEAGLADLDTEQAAMRTAQDVVDFVERAVAEFPFARPAQLDAWLRPLAERLDAIDREAAGTSEQSRKSAAKAMMAGIAFPPLPVGAERRRSLDAIAAGEVLRYGREEMGFFAGMVMGSMQQCSDLSVENKLRLTELLKQGVQLAFGAEYMGSPQEMIGSMLSGQASYVDGVDFVEDAGCGNAYVVAILQLLAAQQAERGREAGGRAPLFVRSCALDREASQCECVLSVVSTAYPDIASQRFSTDIFPSVIERNPQFGLELAGRCGVVRY